ncbi:MAG: sortase [Sphingomonadaceae bacterium]|nr:sortase [Sphingomonadaceae bacterium]
MSALALRLPQVGGRASWRALLPRLFALLLVVAGLVQFGQGLWIPVKAQVAQVLLDRSFSASMDAGAPLKPWPWADMQPVARITATRLDVSDVVLSGASGQAMAFGPTEVLDNGSVRILAAHRDTHFRFMRDLRVGDELVLQGINGVKHRYRVTHFQTVRWDGFAYPVSPDRELLALATCYPFDAVEPGPLRRVAWAELVE